MVASNARQADENDSPSGEEDDLVAVPTVHAKELKDEHHEMLVLSSIMRQGEILAVLRDNPRLRLHEDDFTNQRRREFWKIAEDLVGNGIALDPVVMYDRAQSLEFDKITQEYLREVHSYLLLHGINHLRNVELWAELVIECSRRRKLVEYGQTIAGLATNTGMSIDEAHGAAFNLLTVLRNEGSLSVGYRPLAYDYEAIARDAEDWFNGVPTNSTGTGFYKLDQVTGGGFHRGRLMIIAGRPGMLKTSAALHFAHNVAAGIQYTGENACVAVQSLEMQRRTLCEQMACRYAGIDYQMLTGGWLAGAGEETERQRNAFLVELRRISALPIYVDETDTVSPEAVYMAAAMRHATQPIKLLIIDYAELLGEEDGRSAPNEEQRLSRIVRQSKAIAKRLNITVILICQLNRQLESTQNKIPKLSSLKHSSMLEQTADDILFAYYPFKYQEVGDDVKTSDMFRVERDAFYFIIAKARFGKVGKVDFKIVPEYTLLLDSDPPPQIIGAPSLGTDLWRPGIDVIAERAMAAKHKMAVNGPLTFEPEKPSWQQRRH